MASVLTARESWDVYEDGKHRRYNLLFAVNGGAFAVAKLLTGEPGKPGIVLGGLTLPALALGMIAFTVVMVFDIAMFGCKMRTRYRSQGFFAWPGWLVLGLIALLLVVGWGLVAFGPWPGTGGG